MHREDEKSHEYSEPIRNDPEFQLIVGPSPGRGDRTKTVDKYIGLGFEADASGVLRRFWSTDPEVRHLKDIYKFHRVTYVVCTKEDLYVLLKNLLPWEVWWELDENLSPRSHDDLMYYWLPDRHLTIWKAGREQSEPLSISIASIGAWLPHSKIDRLVRKWGLPSNRAEVAKAVAEEIAAFKEYYTGVHMPKHVSAPADVGRHIVENSGLWIWSIDERAQEEAFNALHAPIADVFQKGFLGQGDDIDVRSGYPWWMLNAPDFAQATTVYSTMWQEEAVEGYLYCDYEIFSTTPTFCCVRARQNSQNQDLMVGAGVVRGWLTKREVEHLHYARHGKLVKIHTGCWLFTKSTAKALRNLVSLLLEDRIVAVNSNAYVADALLKKVCQTCFGLWLERYRDPRRPSQWLKGKYFSPVHANWVMTGLKLQMELIMMRKPGIVINESIDGAAIRGPASQLLSSKELAPTAGNFKAEGLSPIYSVGPYCYHHNKREAETPILKLLQENPDEWNLSISSKTRVSPTRARKLKDPARLANLVETTSHIDLSNPHGKRWDQSLNFARDYLNKSARSSLQPIEIASLYQNEEEEDDDA